MKDKALKAARQKVGTIPSDDQSANVGFSAFNQNPAGPAADAAETKAAHIRGLKKLKEEQDAAAKVAKAEKEAAAKIEKEAKAAAAAVAKAERTTAVVAKREQEAQARAAAAAERAARVAANKAVKDAKAAELAASGHKYVGSMLALSERVKAGAYVKSLTGQLRSTDDLAVAFDAVPPANVVALGMLVFNETNKYPSLNIGQQSMNYRNRMRGAIRKGLEVNGAKVTLESIIALRDANNFATGEAELIAAKTARETKAAERAAKATASVAEKAAARETKAAAIATKAEAAAAAKAAKATSRAEFLAAKEIERAEKAAAKAAKAAAAAAKAQEPATA